MVQHVIRGTRRPLQVLFVACAALLVSACAVSRQQEIDMGAAYSQQVAQQLPLIKDAELLRYVAVLGDSLAFVSGTQGMQFHFNIVDSKEVNAFALPGGWIYINRGLIARAQSMDQVAGVLAHEIGHVTRHHTAQQMQQQQKANIGLALTCTLTKVCDSGAAQSAINLGGTALFMKFSRDDEREADVQAVRNTIKAKIDPSGVVEMFQILLAEQKTQPTAVDAFFSSHPLDAERIANARALIATYPAAAVRGLRQDTPAFQAFKRRLASMPPSPPVKAAAK